MKFTHLTDTPFTTFKTPKNLGKDFKPHGVLWVANEKQWKEFVDWKTYKYEQEFQIDMSKVIELKTYQDIKDFDETYGIKTPEYTIINWNKVRKDSGKSGIYIKDAQIKKARQEFLWYSAFDIECVGIWRKDCIISNQMLS